MMNKADEYSELTEWLNSEDGQAFTNIFLLHTTLAVDASMSHSNAKNDGGLYAIRQYVRALFAMIEGTIYHLKQLAKRASKEMFSSAELALMAEESYDLNDRGEPNIKPNYLKLEKNIKFAFSVYAKSVGLIYNLPVHEPGWNSLKQSINVRNRLMHPKKLSDLNVTDDELTNILAAHEWFEQKYRELQVLMMDQIWRNKGHSSEQILKFHEVHVRVIIEKAGKEVGMKVASLYYGEKMAEKIAAEYEKRDS